MSEDIFWNADYSFLVSVVENKSAFDNYMNYLQYKEEQKSKNKKR